MSHSYSQKELVKFFYEVKQIPKLFITKVEFANRLSVSRPNLDKIMKQ